MIVITEPSTRIEAIPVELSTEIPFLLGSNLKPPTVEVVAVGMLVAETLVKPVPSPKKKLAVTVFAVTVELIETPLNTGWSRSPSPKEVRAVLPFSVTQEDPS